MRKLVGSPRGRLALTTLAVIAAWLCGAAAGASAAPRSQSVAGELIVGFRHGSSSAQRKAALAKVNAHTKTPLREIGAALVTLPRGTEPRAIARLRNERGVRYAEPNFILRASTLPNDPGFSNEWGLYNTGQVVNFTAGTPGADIGAPSAWDVTTGSPSAVVGVIDTGIDASHPDLSQNIWLNPGENCPGCRNDGIDNDRNGYVDDWRGWDFVNNDDNPSDDNGHGTHVAGTVGATGNNGVGVAGVDWNVKLMALKFIRADGTGTASDAIRALLYAADKGATASNNSYGGDGFSQAFDDAIAYADRAGSLFVAAAGNSGSSNDTSPSYPASYKEPNVISVAATNSSDGRAWFSNYGRQSVDLGAPGDNIYSTWPGGGYQFESGTSMASPHVAGAAALAKAAFPAATGVGLKALLLRTVDPNSSLATSTASGGRLDAGNALHCAGTAQAWIESPAPGFVSAAGAPVTVTAIGASCGDPGPVSVSATANGSPIALSSRGDGLYSGAFTPTDPGPVTVAVSAAAPRGSDSQTVSGTVPTTIVPGGAPVTVNVGNPGDNALLAFSGTAGRRVSLQLSGVTIGTSSCCSARVSILNPDGTTLVGATSFGTSGAFVDTKTLPQSGTYTILVDPQGTATGGATLTLNDVPPDVTSQIVPGGAAVTLPATTVAGQNAQVRFSGTAGRRVSLQLTGVTIGTSSCCSARVSILNPDGTTLVGATPFGTSGAFVDTKTLPQSGTYTIVVDPQGTATGGATLRLNDVPPDVTSQIVAGGPAVTLPATTVPGQNAQAAFSGTAGRRVSLSVGPTCCSTKVSLTNPSGTTLVSPTLLGTGGGFIDTKSLPQSGTYAILVDPQGTATGSTTLSLYDVPPDLSGSIAIGGPSVTVTIPTPGQNATLSFSGTAGRTVTLQISGVTVSSSKVAIAKPDGSSLAGPTYVFTSGKTITTQLPVDGTYTIVIDPQVANVGSMTLALS